MQNEIKVGSKVRLRCHSDLDNDGEETIEVGVVIHIYPSEDLAGEDDAYIAFFGEQFPTGKPVEKPYILRYFVSSLELIENPE